MTGPVLLRSAQGYQYVTMSRPDPPESDTIVKTYRQGGKVEYVFAGYEDEIPVYVHGQSL